MKLGKYTLRPLQVAAVENLRAAIARGRRFVLLQACPGFGKTVVSSAITSLATERGRFVLFMASGRQLIYQKSRKLTECDIPHGVLMAQESYEPNHRAIVSSKDTLWSRVFENKVMTLPEADVVLIDEAHLACGGTWQQIIAKYPNATFIGFSATPALGNGKSLPLYQEIVRGGTYQELIEQGFLVPARVYAPFCVDMTGVAINPETGEYVSTQAAQKYQDDELIGDVIRDWRKYAENRVTACFCSSVDHSIYVAEQFNAAGIPAAHIDADTSQEERDDVLRRAEAREIMVICNFAVFTTGVDFPFVECVQIVRAMNSLNTYLQTVGRGFRSHTFPDGRRKTDAVIIDHGGNVHKHGWPTADHEWGLDSDSTVQERDAKKSPPKERQPITCPICGACREKGPECPQCGHKHTRNGLKVRLKNGELQPLKEKKEKVKREVSDDQKAWVQCLSVAFHRGMTVNAARAMFNKKLGHWPPDFVQPQVDYHKGNLPVPVVFPNWGRRKKGGDA